jgi:hypothetical protein
MSKTKKHDQSQSNLATGCRNPQAHSTVLLALASWHKPQWLQLETLDQLIDHAADLSRFMFDVKGIVPLTWVCVLKNGDLALLEPQVTIQDKDAVAEAVRRLFKSLDVERYAVIAESWTGELRPGEKNDRSLALRHDGGESVWMYAEDRTEAQAAEMRVLRTEHGKATLSAHYKFPCGAGDRFRVEGRFAGLLAT